MSLINWMFVLGASLLSTFLFFFMRRRPSRKPKYQLVAFAVLGVPTSICFALIIWAILEITRSATGSIENGWYIIIAGLIVIPLVLRLLQKRTSLAGGITTASWLEKLKSGSVKFGEAITTYRNHPVAYAFYVVGGWWIVMWIFWLFRGIDMRPWNFFALHLWDLTFWTPIIVLPAVYLIATKSKVIRGLGIAMVAVTALFWYWATPNGTFPSSPWPWNSKASATERQVQPTSIVLPTITATEGGWTTPVNLKAEFWRNFNSYREGKWELDYSAPVKARLVFNGESREVILTPGSKPDYGPVDEMSFQAPGDADVSVHIIISK